MSATDISIPLELDHDVNEWSENDVELFLMANMKRYRLMNQDIQAVKLQRVSGFNLLDLTGADFGRCGLPVGPANTIVQLVNKLKVTKGLGMPGK